MSEYKNPFAYLTDFIRNAGKPSKLEAANEEIESLKRELKKKKEIIDAASIVLTQDIDRMRPENPLSKVLYSYLSVLQDHGVQMIEKKKRDDHERARLRDKMEALLNRHPTTIQRHPWQCRDSRVDYVNPRYQAGRDIAHHNLNTYGPQPTQRKNRK